MNNELVELTYKKLLELDKKVELYYEMLKVENELHFILNGTYLMEEDLLQVLNGEY